MHVTPGLDGVSRAVNEAERGLLPAEATIVAGQPLTMDASRAPEGAGLLWIQLQELPSRVRGDAAGELGSMSTGTKEVIASQWRSIGLGLFGGPSRSEETADVTAATCRLMTYTLDRVEFGHRTARNCSIPRLAAPSVLVEKRWRERQVFAATIRSAPTFSIVSRSSLPIPRVNLPEFSLRIARSRSYDITPDGKQFIIVTPARPGDKPSPPQINVAVNWFEELKARVPTK